MRQKSYTIVTSIIISGLILFGAFKPEAKATKERVFVYNNDQPENE